MILASQQTAVQAPSRFLSTATATAAADTTKSVSQPAMFCRQCEQTADHYACVTTGVCGKTAETAASQDALVQQIKSVSHWAVQATKEGQNKDLLAAVHKWTLAATFSTLTNVNFSVQRIADYIAQGQDLKEELRKAVVTPPTQDSAALDLSGKTVEELEEFGLSVSVPLRAALMGHADAFALNEIGTYGLKGTCAYAMHCVQLGVLDHDVCNSIQEVWSTLDSNEPDVNGLLATALKVGAINATVLSQLDGAHADNFGAPESSQVRTTPVAGHCILVSGHDMMDLHALLEQTVGTGVNVYTHGEMLPAHAYPKLKAFPHLAGNYGTAWQNQKFEFAAFPGPIIVNTNCVQEPRRMYKDRLYTMNEVGVDGVQHIGPDRDYSKVIEQAKQLKGFNKTFEPGQFITTGFNHRAVLPLAEKVLTAAASGALSRIFLIGGCDGSQWDRSYFTDLAEATPADSLILTLGCAKNRIIHSKPLMEAVLGDTGIPRVLDMGQCNDSYSAVVVATELAKALNCTVNDLPLSLVLSHLEQKAAAVLLTLLHLGVKNIRLGPSLPSYMTPNVLSILQREYNLMGTDDAETDLANMMQGN
jgi:hydroxylamine reductase